VGQFARNIQPVSLSVHSSIGQIVYQENILEEDIIDLTHLNDGVYLMKLSSEKFTKFERLTISK
jgi:hypothetical protein